MSIPIYDNFDNALGEFPDYDTYDPHQLYQLGLQKHVDIRSFEQTSITQAYTMFDLDGLTMEQLDLLTMGDLESSTVLQDGEDWTNGTVGPQPSYNNFPGIQLTCPIGTTVTQSVMSTTIDISAFATPDRISLTLPALDSNILMDSSLLSFSSDGFTTQCDLPFSDATFVTTDSTNYEAQFPASLVTGIDTTSINGVRLTIAVSGSTVPFICLAIRAIAATWEYAPVDINTLYPRLQNPVPPDGNLFNYTFPVGLGSDSPGTSWPFLMRSDATTITGPTMVDMELGFTINLGSNLNGGEFNILFRELPMTWTTMEVIDGYTMSYLEGLTQLPDYVVGNLDQWAITQYTQAYIEWGSGAVSAIGVYDSITDNYYEWDSLSGFESQQDYYFHISLEDDSIRITVYPQLVSGVILWDEIVFDSTAIVDSNFNRRRRGRFGWSATIGDGDAYIKRLRPERIVYGEYRSAPLASVTPVTGAQIYASSTPDQELYTGCVPTTGALVVPDVVKSNSGHSLRITCDGTLPLEGLMSLPVIFESLADAIVSFDILAPASVQLDAVLKGEGRIIQLNIPPLPINHWQHVEIDLEASSETFIPGTYSLYIVQATPLIVTFYIDNISIREQSVSWQGRVPASDPWGMNDPPWVRYGDQINSPYYGGVLGRGNTLQIRGQTITQDGYLDRVKIIPKYATLGNFIWSDEAPSYPDPPVPSFISSPDLFAPGVNLDASATTFAVGYTGDWYWNFGDGTEGSGEMITHIYAIPGSYDITLTAIDSLNQQVSITQTVTVAL